MYFAKHHREELKKTEPGLSLGEVGKACGAAWSKLDDKAKAPFQKEAEKVGVCFFFGKVSPRVGMAAARRLAAHGALLPWLAGLPAGCPCCPAAAPQPCAHILQPPNHLLLGACSCILQDKARYEKEKAAYVPQDD
jgi:hypothetical protein